MWFSYEDQNHANDARTASRLVPISFFSKPKGTFHDLNGTKNELKEDKRIQLATRNCKTVEKQAGPFFHEILHQFGAFSLTI